ncbi:MAG TPA: hypothetical protein VKK79_05925, partial [Candidatus Lokiarchaeia archaeon]|nr:hypothetical protein [Candidatus Lokiarchaeia archaeon]
MFQEFISPQIITPLLYKEKYYALDPFATLWKKTENYLMHCKRLVIIGYGFPQTDLKIRELLSEVNTGGSIQEVLVVNPDKKVTKIVKKIFRKQKVTQCKNLATYVTNFMNS